MRTWIGRRPWPRRTIRRDLAAGSGDTDAPRRRIRSRTATPRKPRCHRRRSTMPLIRVSMFPGRDQDQKAELIRRLTDTFIDVCGRPGQTAEGVWVILEEVPPSHWGVAGQAGPE
ncbi:4-oxalocrotonate tautomerase family protein [Kribbella sp. NPDC051586]|uniref:4-oxalocrotonate tautomerase family protein n=1 Tax=Kribbella sp. NPDC051586 TaxID=3364118 RepID=UPI00379FDA54